MSMKKTISLLVALLLGAGAAFAQENGVFNHLSIGVGLLGTDGEGIQVAAPLGNYFGVRAGFTTQAAVFGIANSVVAKNVEELDGINPIKMQFNNIGLNTKDIVIDNLDVEGYIRSNNLQLLFDFFPVKTAGLHLTAGAYFNLSPNGLVRATAIPSRKDGQKVFPGAKPNDTEFYGISADPEGKIHLDLQYGCKLVRPYVGIGAGRPVSLKHRVGVNFDFGFVYLGGLNVVTYSYYKNPDAPEAVVINSEWIDKNILSDPSINEDGRNAANKIKEYLAKADEFPYTFATKLFPVLKLSLFIRLF